MSITNVVRLDNWWFSKIPPLLAIACLQVLLRHMTVDHALPLLGCLLFSIACVAAYGHVVNDIFDMEADRRAGKPNAMAGLPRRRQALICAALAGGGFLPLLRVDYSIAGSLVLLLNYAWPTVYSLPRVRLKERGVWGVLCDAAGSHVTPTLLIVTVFSRESVAPAAGQMALALVAVVWSCVLGIKGILYHQVADRENDRASATTTFATAAPPDQLERFLPRYNLFVEWPASLALVLVVFGYCPLAALALLGYCSVELVKYRAGFQFALDGTPRNTRASFPFVNSLFYTVWFPFAAVVQLALRDPAWLWLPFLHVALFGREFRTQARDLGAVLVASWRAVERRWRRVSSRLAAAPATIRLPVPETRIEVRSAPVPRETLTHTISDAVSFLRARQTAYGELMTERSPSVDLTDSVPDSCVFTTAIAVCSLEHAAAFAVEDIRAAGSRFLIDQMEDGGVWRYWSTHSRHRSEVPLDADDTAYAAFALRTVRPDVFRGRNVQSLLRCRTREGLFLTWLEDPVAFGWPNDVDAVVNANVLLYLGDGDETRNASSYLCSLVEADREAGSYVHYLGHSALYFALSRACYHGLDSLRRVADRLTAKVVRQITEGAVRSELDAALSLCTLFNTGAACTSILRQLAHSLVQRQQANGGWSRHAYWRAGETGYFGSSELVTVLCVEALSRYQSIVGDR